MLSLGAVIYLMMEGMLAGFDKASFQNVIDFETGHIKIRNAAFDEDFPYDIDNYIKDTQPIQKKLSRYEFVKAATGRIEFSAEVDNGNESSPVVAVGIDLITDKSVFNLEKFIAKGTIDKDSIVMGNILARDLGVDIGSLVYLTFRDREGMYSSMEMPIGGIVQSADPKVNNSMVFISRSKDEKFLDVTGATDISVKTDDFQKAPMYKKIIEKALPDVKVQSWQELSTDFAALMNTKRKASNIFLLLIIIIALVGIINTLLMSVYEKKQEIGTLLAMGMSQGEVRNIFLLEGFIIGFLGSLLGIAVGAIINSYFIYVGIDYTAMMGEGGMGFNVIGIVKSVWVPSSYLKALIICVIVSVISSIYPAGKVMKMTPMECLRTVQ